MIDSVSCHRRFGDYFYALPSHYFVALALVNKPDSQNMASDKMHKGGCLCMGVQYILTGDPISVAICHCPDCKASSGCGFGLNAWYEKEVSILSARMGIDVLNGIHPIECQGHNRGGSVEDIQGYRAYDPR